jgi:hypothetical protein
MTKKPKLSGIFSKIKIAAALSKLVLTGNSKTIEKVEKGVEIAEAIKDLLKPASKQ